MAGNHVRDRVESGIEHADFHRARVAAGVSDHLRYRDVIGIAERRGERDRDGVLRQAFGQVGAAADGRVGANNKRDVSLYRIASGANRPGSDLVTPIR